MKYDFEKMQVFDFGNLNLDENSAGNCYGTCNDSSCDTSCDCVCDSKW